MDDPATAATNASGGGRFAPGDPAGETASPGADRADGADETGERAAAENSELLQETQRALDAEDAAPSRDQPEDSDAGADGDNADAEGEDGGPESDGGEQAQDPEGAGEGEGLDGERQDGGERGDQRGRGAAPSSQATARAEDSNQLGSFAAAGTGPQSGLAAVLGDDPVVPLDLLIDVESTPLAPDAPAPQLLNRPGQPEDRSSRRGEARTGLVRVRLAATAGEEQAIDATSLPWRHWTRLRDFFLFDPQPDHEPGSGEPGRTEQQR